MTDKKAKSIDEIIDTMQDQIMDLSKEIAERECRERYAETMSAIVHYLMIDLNDTTPKAMYSDTLNDRYGIKPKDQQKLKEAFIKSFNDNFDQMWGKSNDTK